MRFDMCWNVFLAPAEIAPECSTGEEAVEA
jgi:hypothetical protein